MFLYQYTLISSRAKRGTYVLELCSFYGKNEVLHIHVYPWDPPGQRRLLKYLLLTTGWRISAMQIFRFCASSNSVIFFLFNLWAPPPLLIYT
jgi:hypothetical protein